MFKNRSHAGQLLAEITSAYLESKGLERDPDLIVVGLPRGGVPVARQVALSLGVPLTILVSKKIGAPHQSEYAIGAVSSTGVAVLNPDLGMPSSRQMEYLQSERHRLAEATRTLENHWLSKAGQTRIDFNNKVVLLVDDGVATGMTVIAAARSLRRLGVRRLILAVPVIARSTLAHLRPECDEILAVEIPTELLAVGNFYEDFDQVNEAEVIDDLRSANRMSVAN